MRTFLAMQLSCPFWNPVNFFVFITSFGKWFSTLPSPWKYFFLTFDLSPSTLLNATCLLKYKTSKHRSYWCVALGYPAFCMLSWCFLQQTNHSLTTWLPIEIITKPDVKRGVGYQRYVGDLSWKILLMQKPLLRDSRSRRSGQKDVLAVQPRALLLAHSISCSLTRGAP